MSSILLSSSIRSNLYSLQQTNDLLATTQNRLATGKKVNSANDNPLIHPDTGALYKAGNFYGGHIARLLDTWKIDFASMANWGNALMALLVDDRFSDGLPANLTPQPGVNS